jgi:hypothetical protein
VPSAYAFPAQVTPFTVLNLLQRMKADEKLSFSAEQSRELSEAIAGLQEYFFDRPVRSRNGGPDLEDVARRWLSCAK